MTSSTNHFRLAFEAELEAQHSDFSRLLLAASLAAAVSEEGRRQACAAWHLRLFRDWLTKTLLQQREDLARFRSAEHAGRVLECLITLARAQLVPAEATPEEAALFQSDLTVALDQGS